MNVVKLMADPFPPYQYYTSNGNIKGIDFQIIRESFLLKGYDIEVELMEWGELSPYFDQKLVHGLFQVQPTEEREKIYLFSDTLRKAKTSFFSRIPERYVESVDELLNERTSPLGLLQTYNYGELIDNLEPELKKGYGESLELLEAVNNGDIDHCIFDYGVAIHMIKENNLKNVHPVGGFSFLRPLAIAFQKNEAVLCQEFNSGLKKLKEKGRYNEILQGQHI